MPSWLLQAWRRLTACLQRRRLHRDLDDELEFHLAMRQQQLIADGLAEGEAGREARRRFGNVLARKEEMRDLWTFHSIESIGQDVEYAVRNLRGQRWFTATVVLVLAAVIGLNATLFTVMAGIVLRPWPGIAAPSRVVRLYLADPTGHAAGFSLADARALASRATSLAGVAVMKNEPARAGPSDTTATIEALMVDGNFFDLLGVRMARGRGFLASEDRLGAPAAVVVLTFAYWQRQFGGDPAIVGSTLRINDVHFSIVGVAPADFGSAEPIYDKHVFLPISSLALLKPGDVPTQKFLYNADACCVDLVARLSPDSSHTEARAELTVLTSGYRTFSATARGVIVTGTEFFSQPGRADSTQAMITATLLAAGLLLVWLLACANVGNLFLSRATARVGEIATRLALGASRWRIVRQLLIEGLLLSLLAGALGVLVASQLPSILFQIVAESGTVGSFPFSVSPDALVLAYSVILAGLSSVAFALAPALQTTRVDIVESLKRRQSLSARRLPLRSLLLGVQIAVSVVLLVSAGLLIRGVQRQAGVFDPGFAIENITTVQFALPEGVYDRARAVAFFDHVAASLRQLPIDSFAFTSHAPFSRYQHGTIFHLPGESREQARPVLYLDVSPEYLTLLDVPLRSGRYFESGDIGRPVVIISESMAKRFWPRENPVGTTFFIRPRGPIDSMAAREIVGVVADVRTSTANTVTPLFYHPTAAGADVFDFISHDPRASQAPTLLVKTTQDLSGEMSRLAAHLDPRVRVSTTSLSASVDAMLKTARWGPILAAALGIFALGLATVGVFGVFGYAVRQQRREIGIRMALGADPAAVLRVLLTEHARALIGGLVVGLAGSIAASILLRHRLHGVSPFDPLAYLTVAVLLLCAGLAAGLMPARAAIRVNPSQTLREI